MSFRDLSRFIAKVSEELYREDTEVCLILAILACKSLDTEQIRELGLQGRLGTFEVYLEQIKTNRRLNRLTDLTYMRGTIAEMHAKVLRKRVTFRPENVTPEVLESLEKVKTFLSKGEAEYVEFRRSCLEDYLTLHLAFRQPLTYEAISLLGFRDRPVMLDKKSCEALLDSVEVLEREHSNWFKDLQSHGEIVEAPLKIATLFDTPEKPEKKRQILIDAGKLFVSELEQGLDTDNVVEELLTVIEEVKKVE